MEADGSTARMTGGRDRPLVGRELELERLGRAWRDAGQLVLVRGIAGIGKSRVVRELQADVRRREGVALSGRCTPTAADVPLRPFREALLAAARAGLRPPAELAAFLPALGSLVPEWSTADAVRVDGGAVVIAEGVLRLMCHVAKVDAPTLLVIEDVHWADRETLAAIEYLADNVEGYPVTVVLTGRTGEGRTGEGRTGEGRTGEGRTGEGRLDVDVIEALVARRSLGVIDLVPLDDEHAAAMARTRLGEAIPDSFVRAVVARADGVPFFIEELLATALDDATAGTAVPSSIRAAIASRLAALPSGSVQFLQHAALLGRQFDWRIVAHALGSSLQQSTEHLRAAAASQLVDLEGASFRFRHALTAEAVQQELLPEERQASCALLSRSVETLHPELEGELCQLAAELAAGAGDVRRAAELWLEAARRAMRGGWLATAEALAVRAGDALPVAADRALVTIWSLAGQPRRALQAGRRVLSSSPDPALSTQVRFDLLDAMIAAGRWDDADNYLSTLRSSSLDRAGACRRSIGEAEVALGRGDPAAASALATSALAVARADELAEELARALWVIGRVERERDVAAASAAFGEAYESALRHGLVLPRIKSLLELGTIDLFTTLRTDRLEQARREAIAAGALATAAMVDLQLAAAYSCQGRAEQTLEASVRCEEVSRRFGLASLPMSLALQAVAHALRGDREAMQAMAKAARATRGDVVTVEIVLHGNAFSTWLLGRGELAGALRELEECMAVLRANGGGAHPFPGRWALLSTVLDEGGVEARAECRALELDTEMSRVTLAVADAVAAGRQGEDPGRGVDAALVALEQFEGGFLRSLALLLVAPCARRDGWGDPVRWTRDALANFESLGLPGFAQQCRVSLRAMGERAPRATRGDGPKVPPALAGRGVTSREMEVLSHVAAGRTNREIAALLHLSVRTVEKHVERVIMKTGRTRPELATLASEAGVVTAG